MNNSRRQQIEDIITRLNAIKSDVESILDDEQEYLDNIPENLQTSERYEKADAAVYNLESTMDQLDEIMETLQIATE